MIQRLRSSKKEPNPPKGFDPAKSVQWASLLAEPPSFITRPAKYGAKGRGIRYEKKVQGILENRYGERYVPSPWILFSEGSGLRPRYCQPDGLLIDFIRGRITIVEIKYNHCELAWWQLFRLYRPVVSHIFGQQWEYSCCEVVKWYDPATHVSQEPHLQRDIEYTQPDIWGVNICNPRRL